ncbi:uncharacterized protein LOC110112225 [Dendrobium catenatum]|uniref:DUF1995 domain-containing protein n=1 Tax=Dendrobium catenatum TaxID=906689 RepID=A0A2I0VVM0_9ASPA|nr:uncharacterized protein LOC110112225 [Dendrobium catenatum]PKU67454.1 hypothetical protein MA16_Dca020380 [Dendrobium catenatum]
MANSFNNLHLKKRIVYTIIDKANKPIYELELLTMASNPLKLLHKPAILEFRTSFPKPATFILQPLSKTISICSLSPPTSREEAVSQAKSCLSSSLQKPLNNSHILPTSKLKKQRQPRFRVEIPIADDDSPSSLASLAADLFSSLPITKKGSSPNLLLFWSSSALLDPARRAFTSSNSIFHFDIASFSNELLNSADLAVFLAPEASMLEQIRVITNSLSPKPAVLFNPKWSFEEEKGFDGQLGRFVGSFDVVYSFMGLEVRGLLSRRKAVVFKWVRDGVMSGDGWVVMVEDEGNQKGDLQVVSRFKRRPEIGEVENVMYNLMAANSPVTKSVKFFRDLASNITGKKKE